jgi:phospholipase D1/2
VMVIDDRVLRIGSANLSNRSMAVDTECDIAIEADGDAEVARGIAGVRNRLLGEHLGVAARAVAAATAESGSLIAGIETLQGRTHTLMPLERPCPGWLDALPPEVHLFDPAEPIDPERLIQQLVPEDMQRSFHHSLLRGAAVLLVLASTVAVSTALGFNAVALTEPALRLADHPELVVLLFVVGGLAYVPVTVMILVTTFVLGPRLGLTVAVVGVLASAVVTYGVGRGLGRERVRRLAGPHLNRLSVRLARRSVPAFAAARVLAVAPFTTMNLVAGATRVSFGDYLLGTLLGTVPGVVAIAVGTGGLVALLRRFVFVGIAASAATGLGLLAIGLRLGRPARASRPVSTIAGAAGHA